MLPLVRSLTFHNFEVDLGFDWYLSDTLTNLVRFLLGLEDVALLLGSSLLLLARAAKVCVIDFLGELGAREVNRGRRSYHEALVHASQGAAVNLEGACTSGIQLLTGKFFSDTEFVCPFVASLYPA